MTKLVQTRWSRLFDYFCILYLFTFGSYAVRRYRMKFALLMLSLFFAGVLRAQDRYVWSTLRNDGTPVPREGSLVLTPSVALSLHDWSLKQIEDLDAYQEAKRPGHWALDDGAYEYYGFQKWFKVKRDGTYELHGMTLEDAFLMLYASDAQRLLQTEKNADAEEEAREAAEEAQRQSVPPTKIKVRESVCQYDYKGGSIINGDCHSKATKLQTWPMTEQPEWETDVAGTTYCGPNFVRILDASGEKQIIVLHELMHVATGCDSKPGLHEFIYQLAPSLLNLLQDNPDIAAYLTKKLPPKPPLKPRPDKDGLVIVPLKETR